jgi:putative methyltransferase (TIGR04325 family)
MVNQIKKAAKWLLPPIVLLPFRPGYRSAPDEAPHWHQGDYPDWVSATAAAKGYDAPNILEIQRAAMRKVRDGAAVYERDSVVFDKIEYFFPTLAALLLIASRNNNRLSVLDFGGALGSTYYQNRHLLSHLSALSWHVVEQPHFVSAGRAEFENEHLRFYPTIVESCAAARPDVVLFSSVLQYLEKPTELLAEIAAAAPPYILVDRTPILDSGRERIVIQTVPPSIYPASYACRLFAPGAMEAVLAPAYDVVFDFEVHIGTTIQVDDSLARYRGMLFQRRPVEAGAP